ncbi:hypothetical protein GCM10010912_18090 [Paenibacillus albidus]|uniref:Uncharacterized protein n=1 Tax=Paenibacillus albidus TaxID=2041023 RepID=A0A917C5P2_9BACL|nr:hypothetical protein [Paenibacillus albidus]GGF73259.1 hypothetical protein GCM10010912_18090 [Paenibacillus albidus]
MPVFKIPVISMGEQFEMTQDGETYFHAVASLHDSLNHGVLRVDLVRLDLTQDQTAIIDALDRKRNLEVRIKTLRQYIEVVWDMPRLTERAERELKDATKDLKQLIEGIEIKMTTLRDAAI